MFEITHLALLVVVSIITLFTNLSGLLIISSVLQAGSVLNVTTELAKTTGTNAYGVTVFHLMALIVTLSAAKRFFSGSRFIWPCHLNLSFIFLFSYFLVATLGALWLPKIFSGIQVNDLIKIHGVFGLSPLVWNFGHIVQIINLFVIVCVLISILFLCQSDHERRGLICGVALSCAITLFIGFYEQIAPFFNFNSYATFWANNPGYSQAPLAPMGYLFNRIGLPFSEPSYASAYMSAMLLGTTALSFFGKSWWWTLIAFLCAGGLINTLGSTGIAAAVIAFTIMLIWVIIFAFRKKCTSEKRFRIVILCSMLFISSILAANFFATTSFKPQIEKMVSGLIIDKVLARDPNSPRAITNWRAVEILKETNGLGVGMGSQRSSSFFASLLANTGVLGFGLFLGLIGSLFWRYFKATSLSEPQIFVAAALPTATLAMGLGIPDLNMPMYWVFIILGFVFCPGNEAGEVDGVGGCPPARAGQIQ